MDCLYCLDCWRVERRENLAEISIITRKYAIAALLQVVACVGAKNWAFYLDMLCWGQLLGFFLTCMFLLGFEPGTSVLEATVLTTTLLGLAVSSESR